MIKAAAVFSDHMVLQRQKNVLIWGETDSKEEITATINGITEKALVKENRFEVTLPPMEAGGPYMLILNQGKEQIIYKDVLLGDVWYAGGQSNMELAIINSKDGERVTNSLSNASLRFYNVQRKSYIDQEFLEEEEKTCWEECKEGMCGKWSAVATYFATYLQQELNVPIGIIGCNLGGSSASCWTSKERLASDKDTLSYIEAYDKAMEGKTVVQYEQELEEYNKWYEVWQKKVDELYKENPEILWSEVEEIAGKSRWPEPMGPRSPFRPGGLHETMTKRVAGYQIKGILYYQGEDDVKRASYYDKVLSMVIAQLREDFNDPELPFLYVMLPMQIFKEEKDTGEWAVLREKQLMVYKTIKNTGLAVAIDCGEYNNIHPLDKEPVGRRLALQALSKVYNKSVKADGPSYQSASMLRGSVVLTFDNVQGWLEYHEDETYKLAGDGYENEQCHTVISNNGFEAAGEDGVFHKAKISLIKNKVTVSCKEAGEIVSVRYGYHNFSPVTVFDKAGFPLHPFCIQIRGKKL